MDKIEKAHGKTKVGHEAVVIKEAEVITIWTTQLIDISLSHLQIYFRIMY
jgi:hypothetical protein